MSHSRLLVTIAIASVANAQLLETTLVTAGGPVCLQIEDERNDQQWRAYYAKRVGDLIRAYEEFLGIPFLQAAAVYFQDGAAGAVPCVRVVGREVVSLGE